MSEPITCKAAVTWEPGAEQVIEDVIIDVPEATEVRIKMVVTAICRSDISKWKGKIVPPCEFPLIVGHEGAGVVESVGSDVKGLAAGDHVIPTFVPYCGTCTTCLTKSSNLCDAWNTGLPGRRLDGSARVTCHGKELSTFTNLGTFSEYILCDQAYVAKVDPSAPLEKICTISCAVGTGYGSAANKVSEGDSVAVFGLGAVGLCVILGAKNVGASKIIAVDTNSKKFQIAERFGATDFINPKDSDKPTEDVIHAMTNGGVDYGFECIGSVEVMETAFRSTAETGGTTVVIGVAKGGDNVSFNPFDVLFGRKITGAIFGGYKGRKDIPELVNMYMEGKLDIDDLITHHMKLDDINKAFDLIEKSESIRTVIQFD